MLDNSNFQTQKKNPLKFPVLLRIHFTVLVNISRSRSWSERNYVVFSNNHSSFPLLSALACTHQISAKFAITSSRLQLQLISRFFSFSELRQSGIRKFFGNVFAKVRDGHQLLRSAALKQEWNTSEREEREEEEGGIKENARCIIGIDKYNWPIEKRRIIHPPSAPLLTLLSYLLGFYYRVHLGN